MAFNTLVHRRHSTRLDGYDYSSPGIYYITILSLHRECVFGEIVKGEIHLSKIGMIARHEWQRLPERFPGLVLDAYAFMPNHIHGILAIIVDNPERGTPEVAKDSSPASLPSRVTLGPVPVHIVPGSVGAIVRAFKSSVTLRYNRIIGAYGANLWHRNYYDRIIRNQVELERVRTYILNNPLSWDEDQWNSVNER